MLIISCCAELYWLLDSSAAGRLPLQQTSAERNRRLFTPPDYVIGRFTKDGKETFETREIVDPKYPGQNKKKDEYLGEYKYAPIGRKLLIVVHVIGVVYMLVGLNTVCDIYFCGSLDEMVERWSIPPDVAGATLMAAGGSAPELFTSLIGAVFLESDVGFSTIVGSAVFNVLAVIGCCGMAAKDPIKLTWWPLFRDCTFYIISLCLLALFARGDNFSGDELGPDGQLCDLDDEEKLCGGGKILLHEAIILFVMYLLYCTIAYFNEQLQAMAQGLVNRVFGTDSKVEPQTVESPKGVDDSTTKVTSAANINSVTQVNSAQSSGSRSGHEASLKRKHTHRGDPDYINRRYFRRVAHHAHMAIGIAKDATGKLTDVLPSVPDVPTMIRNSWGNNGNGEADSAEKGQKQEDEDTSVSSEATDDIAALMTPPDGEFKEKLQWALCLPVFAPMYFLIPRPDKYFIATFGIALVFIAMYSYFLVYCVQMFSDTILGGGNGVNVVMGFTLLAAGTSIPDLVSSMVVARAGEGDMAVSSSIGSNIFDILVGLPVPWMLKIGLVEMGIEGKSFYGVTIGSPYIPIYVLLLLFMVACVILSILFNKWFLNRNLGIMMGCLYFVFLGIVIPLELLN